MIVGDDCRALGLVYGIDPEVGTASGQPIQNILDALGVTLSAVKKMWRAIYGRASMVLTGAPDQRAGSDSGVRGKEKKQELLAYVRDHPEELRPVSRRLLKRTGRRLSRN